MEKIVIDPVTRIEGHLRMEAETKALPDDIQGYGEVTRASSAGTMVRGLETIMRGRDPREAWAFTQRICGVCTLVHGLATVRAVESALNYEIPANAHLIRNLMLGAQYVHDHVMHFYHLHAMDWVDILSALDASPAETANLQRSLSDWSNCNTEYFAGVQQKLKFFIESGQLGIFANAYWGHPAYRLSPHANLLFFAHYLEVLNWQRQVVKLHAVFGGRNPHPNMVVGGMPCAISARGNRKSGNARSHALFGGFMAVDQDGLATVQTIINQMQVLVDQLFIPDTMLLAEHYKDSSSDAGDLNDWTRIGEGLGNFMTFGDFPAAGASGESGLLIPQGAILERDLSTVYSVDPQAPEQIQEFVSHSWYEYASGKDVPLHPYDGETSPKYTGPSADDEGYKDDDFDVEGSYSWIKSPRWNGKAMETGPLARLNMMIASGNQQAINLVDDALLRLGLEMPALYSTLGRTLARNLETKLFSSALSGWYDRLVANIESGDLDIFNDEFWEPSSWPSDARGVGLVEAPRGALSHYIIIENGKIGNYQAVVPTTWNGSPRDAFGQGGAMEQALLEHRVYDREQPLELLRTIHSFDPCIACAVHLADPDM